MHFCETVYIIMFGFLHSIALLRIWCSSIWTCCFFCFAVFLSWFWCIWFDRFTVAIVSHFGVFSCGIWLLFAWFRVFVGTFVNYFYCEMSKCFWCGLIWIGWHLCMWSVFEDVLALVCLCFVVIWNRIASFLDNDCDLCFVEVKDRFLAMNVIWRPWVLHFELVFLKQSKH